jgi:hypothetical protein
MMATISVTCDGDQAAGWVCTVTLTNGGREISRHEVRVRPADLDRLGPGAIEPKALVTASFGFLLEREPPQSILSSFDLTDIGRYFPEYESEIRGRP